MFPSVLQGFMHYVCLGKTFELFVPQILLCPALPNTLIYSDVLHLAGGWALFSLRKQTLTRWLMSPGSCSESHCFMYDGTSARGTEAGMWQHQTEACVVCWPCLPCPAEDLSLCPSWGRTSFKVCKSKVKVAKSVFIHRGRR